MDSSIKIVFLNAKLSLLSLGLAIATMFLIKIYIDTSLPILMFFVISYFLFHIYKDLFRMFFKSYILELQVGVTDELVKALKNLDKLLNK